MKITKNENNEKITVSIEGRLDKISSPTLEEELKPEVEKKKDIVIDCANLEYISSAGLRILVACEKQLKTNSKSLQLINVNDDVMTILQVTGFVYILNIKG